MPRRILIAPDKFKGSLSAAEAAAAIAEGIRMIDPSAELDLCPIADGGEGFMESLTTALGGEWVTCPAVDALDRPIESRFGLAERAEGRVAILEMAETAGIWRIAPEERNPLMATTRGVGMQMLHAVNEYSVDQIVLGLGGSATNDGGSGMAAALGVGFLDGERKKLDPKPSNLGRVRGLDLKSLPGLPEIIAACDVDNPLLGPNGATAIFSAQKGATDEMKHELERSLEHLSRLVGREELANMAGAGAAGGLGFGLLCFAGARLVSGFDLLANLLELKSRIIAADHVVTGEGSIDYQSLSGKGPVALARLAGVHGVPVTGFCGFTDEAVRESGIFKDIYAVADNGLPLETLIANGAPLLTQAVAASNFLDPWVSSSG
jgi:glycerate kinase